MIIRLERMDLQQLKAGSPSLHEQPPKRAMTNLVKIGRESQELGENPQKR